MAHIRKEDYTLVSITSFNDNMTSNGGATFSHRHDRSSKQKQTNQNTCKIIVPLFPAQREAREKKLAPRPRSAAHRMKSRRLRGAFAAHDRAARDMPAELSRELLLRSGARAFNGKRAQGAINMRLRAWPRG